MGGVGTDSRVTQTNRVATHTSERYSRSAPYSVSVLSQRKRDALPTLTGEICRPLRMKILSFVNTKAKK
jgi:hypothetical protein